MQNLPKISEALFNKIRARFDSVNLGDEKANSTTDPAEARFFNFNYISKNGKNFGNVTVSIIDETSLKIYFSSNITNALDEEEEKEWYSFLKDLKNFARRNMLTFDTRDINRSNLDLKDIKQQSNSDGNLDTADLAMLESKLYGLGNNKHVSFADVGPHKLIIKHRDQINPEVHGARARKIEHIFIETPIGERFLLDHTNLHGARATANHLRHGGRIGDEGSNLINEMVKEMASMKHFVRSMRNRTFEDAETSGMVEAAIGRYNEVKDHLKRFQGRQGKELLNSMISATNGMEEEIDVDALRERFVKKVYDDRFNEALPYVYKAYKKHKEMQTTETKEFESWTNSITSETWDDDTDDHDESELLRLMAKPLLVGVDGVDAKAAVKHVHFLDTPDLGISFSKLAQSQGPDADARRVILGWLATNGENALASQIMQSMQNQNQAVQPQPVSPSVAPQPTGEPTTDAPVVYEELDTIRLLSGLGKK